MKKTIILLSICISFGGALVSCSDSTEGKNTMRTIENNKIVIKHQKPAYLGKESALKSKPEIEPDIFTDTKYSDGNNDLEMELDGSNLLPIENSNMAIKQEPQDTGLPLDPDNEDDIDFISSSADDLNYNEVQDTGVFTNADIGYIHDEN